MPKIEAKNIEEHVRQQTGRILDAASELFTSNGYRGTDLGGIAKSMGLARNSLYRYFPSKDHILLAVVEREMAPFVERARMLADEYLDPAERVDAWLELQMELATGPCHSMIRMLGDMNDASDDLRRQMASLHEAPREALEGAVTHLLEGTGRDPTVVCAMISSMVQSAGGIAMWSGDVDPVVKELKKSVRSILARGD